MDKDDAIEGLYAIVDEAVSLRRMLSGMQGYSQDIETHNKSCATLEKLFNRFLIAFKGEVNE